MSQKHNTINYVEFPSTNVQQSKKFYGELFGWKFTEWGPEYVSFEGAGIDGGFDGTRKPSHALGVLVVLHSENLEATEEQVKNAGGQIVVPIFEFPGGRRFHFKDLCGNELAIWSQ